MAGRDVTEQARRLTERLQEDLQQNLDRVGNTFRHPHAEKAQVLVLAVGGYDDRGPHVVAYEIAIVLVRGRWQALTAFVPGISFEECGARFHGETSVLDALKQDDERIPKTVRDEPDVRILRTFDEPGCTRLESGDSSATFIAATRLTVQLGRQFSIYDGAVGLPLDIVTIPKDGQLSHREVKSW
jgi:hypothetical protein